ncbi:MAG TPA: hypothetical protein VK689_13625 [Armatimonadota bacterium]|nr:hypothetical protein [Armatimonadota bacterium]
MQSGVRQGLYCPAELPYLRVQRLRLPARLPRFVFLCLALLSLYRVQRCRQFRHRTAAQVLPDHPAI